MKRKVGGLECSDIRGSLSLRSMNFDDVETFASWGLDAEFCAAAEWSHGKPLSHFRQHWETIIGSSPADLVRMAVVTGNDQVIGYCDLFGTDPDIRELGFVIGERGMWGRGLGASAASLMLDYGFENMNLTTIVAEAWDANERSIRILRRLGMRETGRGETGVYLGQPTCYRMFELSVSEWRQLNVNSHRE